MASSLAEALRLMDRKRLPSDLRKVVEGSSNRREAVSRLENYFHDDPDVSPQGADEDDENPENENPDEQPDEEPEDEIPAEEPDEGAPEPDDDYDDWSKADLQQECAERDLPTSGNVNTLIARLREDDA